MASDERNQWERVSAELRAYRQLQQQAWGDIDNATLGRFLAGEVSDEERRQVEAALDELPELRKLTDLVRDVLCEFEPAAADPVATPAPVLLPLPTSRPEDEHSALGWARSAPRRRFASRYRQYAALAAAACLLLALGLKMPRPGALSAPQDDAVQPETALAMASRDLSDAPPVPFPQGPNRVVTNFHREPPAAAAPPPRGLMLASPRREGGEHDGKNAARLDRALAKSQQAIERNLQTALALNRIGLTYRRKGDLDRAVPFLSQAHAIWQRTLGPGDRLTMNSLQSLAGVYKDALDAPAGEDTFALRQPPDGVAERKAAAAGGSRDMGRGANTYFEGSSPEPETVMGAVSAPASTGAGYAQRSANPYTANGAAVLYERIACEPPQNVETFVTPVLAQALRQAPSPKARASYARSLGNLGTAARTAVPVLSERLRRSRSPEERHAILAALGDMGAGARAAVPLLLETVQNGPPEAQLAAARSLIALGPCARYALDDPVCRQEVAKDAKSNTLLREVVTRLHGKDGRVGVLDEATCFSARALHESSRSLRRLAHDAGLEVLVETVSLLTPADQKRADERLHEMGPRGVCVLLDRASRTARVSVSEPMRRRGLSARHLQLVLDEHLRRNDYDGGLRAGVRYVARFGEAQAK